MCHQVAVLRDEKANVETTLRQQEATMSKRLDGVGKKLKVAEHDLKVTRKALKSREHVDKKGDFCLYWNTCTLKLQDNQHANHDLGDSTLHNMNMLAQVRVYMTMCALNC